MSLRTYLAAVVGIVAGLSAATTLAQAQAKTEVAIFAAGCFWCTEADFDKIDGVLETTSGYIGGKTKNPTYEQVTQGNTGHLEAVRITFDPARVSYAQLLDHYWINVDAVDDGGQFCDRGSSYRPAIFATSPEQRAQAEKSKADAQAKLKQKIVVPIRDASEFTVAEDYHQDFYNKKPGHYFRYRLGCGRDWRLEQLWGKKAKS